MARRMLVLESAPRRVLTEEFDFDLLVVVVGFNRGESSSDLARGPFVLLEGEPTNMSKIKHITMLAKARAHGIQGEMSIVIAAVNDAISSAM